VNTAANDERGAKVFIIKTEYGYAVSPSPVVVPRGSATLVFENLSDVPATVFIPNSEPLPLDPEKPKSVTLPEGKGRVISYRVDVGRGLFARGNSAPIIIRDA
jgi:hypothetical protein